MKYVITEQQLKVIVNEGFELEKKLIKRLLDKPAFEGICEIEFHKDDNDDLIASILLHISQEYLIEYVTKNGGDFYDYTKKLRNNVRSLIKKHLGLEFYVGSISDC
jgi:predicted ATP-grasp superfamily ATP-dependent carboligase